MTAGTSNAAETSEAHVALNLRVALSDAAQAAIVDVEFGQVNLDAALSEVYAVALGCLEPQFIRIGWHQLVTPVAEER